MNDKKCRHCKELIPPYALSFPNQAAIDRGYCSWFCTLAALGDERALRIVEKYRKKRILRPVEARSQTGVAKAVDEKKQDKAISGGREKNDALSLILSDDPEEVRG